MCRFPTSSAWCCFHATLHLPSTTRFLGPSNPAPLQSTPNSHYHQCQDSSGGFSHGCRPGQHSAISNPPAEFIRQSNSA
ncbi:hypothetical protein EYF80_058279 [Liparis tanakae]|uniref:Uncharacterized protein n=1 Tax=Liparis tanakae TaxID=230148 RepID=A0A4Z2ERY3_9TELE|nr:hypothetical protein EYF80_058279 [Liparis tanakae]